MFMLEKRIFLLAKPVALPKKKKKIWTVTELGLMNSQLKRANHYLTVPLFSNGRWKELHVILKQIES